MRDTLPKQLVSVWLCKQTRKTLTNESLSALSEPPRKDEELLTEYYTKFKGTADTAKYSHIPRFYAKVLSTMSHLHCGRTYWSGSLWWLRDAVMCQSHDTRQLNTLVKSHKTWLPVGLTSLYAVLLPVSRSTDTVCSDMTLNILAREALVVTWCIGLPARYFSHSIYNNHYIQYTVSCFS